MRNKQPNTMMEIFEPLKPEYREQMLKLNKEKRLLDSRIVISPADVSVGDELYANLYGRWPTKIKRVTDTTKKTVTITDKLDNEHTLTAPKKADTSSKHWYPEIAWYNTNNHRHQFLALPEANPDHLKANHGDVLDLTARRLFDCQEKLYGGKEKMLHETGKSHIIPKTTPVDDIENGVTSLNSLRGYSLVSALGWLQERQKNSEEFIPVDETKEYTRGRPRSTHRRLYKDTLPQNALIETLSEQEALDIIDDLGVTPTRIITKKLYESGGKRIHFYVQIKSDGDNPTERLFIYDEHYDMRPDFKDVGLVEN